MAAHFTKAGLTFLKQLKTHNQREWFDSRKQVYETEIKAPMLAVVAEVNNGLSSFAPEFVRDPKKIAMRIYRDIRFSKDKRPYKTHAAAWWARQGLEKTSGGGFYLEVGTDAVRVAAGAYMPEKDQLLAIRRMLLERHEDLRRAMKVRGMVPIDAMTMTRGPKGFPAIGEHPAMDLILQRQWGLTAVLPAEIATKPGLAKEILRRFKLASPLVELLNSALAPKPRQPMF